MSLLWLLACSAGRDFADAQATALCARHARCDALEAAGFESESECLEQLLLGVSVREEKHQLVCDSYDSAAAEACLEIYADTPCDEPPVLDICDDVCAELTPSA